MEGTVIDQVIVHPVVKRFQGIDGSIKMTGILPEIQKGGEISVLKFSWI